MERIIKSKDYDYCATHSAIRSLCKKYPMLTSFTIGKSCAGREIEAIKIGNATCYVLFAAAFHGSEHITTNVLLYFIEELSRALTNNLNLAGINVRKALRGRGVIFVPAVNPDGCEIAIKGAAGCVGMEKEIARLCHGDFSHWNANFRGVDINHNFNAGWASLHALEQKSGILGPAPTRYGGPRPESEPETVALVKLCRSAYINHAIALHAQGEVIYWSYGENANPKALKMAEIMAATSGYALDAPVGIAVGGGFKDWFIEETGRPGFTVELGKGENPLPIASSAKIYADVREMLTLTAIM